MVPADGSSTGESTSGTDTLPTADDTTSSGSSSSGSPDSTGTAPSCGDGLLVEGEDCDDGNSDDLDGCSAMCVREDGWLCNDQPSVCFEVCGDGLVVGEEECDDDNLLDDDGCTVECDLEGGWTCEGEPSECATVCGDSMIVGDEECDDANTDEGDGCDAACQDEQGWNCVDEPSTCSPVCGDGLILGAEECDDFDAVAGDGCSDTCGVELGWSCDGEPSMCMTGCGDGITAGTEQCDDLGLVDGDGCSAACEVESGWMCMGDPSVCVTDCGDGLIAGAETCDDGGIVAGDGCDAMCLTDPGWICAGEPSVCATDCGDGLIVGAELCDDGSIAQGDGCNESCGVDFGWDCVGTPSVCTETSVLADVALGYYGGCVLTSLGEVGCFGDNIQGEVGNGTVNVETFLPVFALNDAIAITSGQQHNCAIRAGGSVWCWGDNLDDQMGPLSMPNIDEPLPIEITGMPPIVAIDAGYDHTCTIDTLGQVWCWGDNLNRQLGHGGVDTTDSPIPQVVPMPGGLTAIDLGLGDDHSCAVLEDNTVACWGDDDNGQLGDGVAGTDSGDAAVVPGLSVVNDVEGGKDTTCALTDLGEVYCWGESLDGQVGVGSTADSPNPQLVTLPATADRITLGGDFSCALLSTDQVFCWGESEDFQTGNGNLIDALTPIEVLDVPPGDIVDIEAGGRGMCLVTALGERWCWGYSEEGQLGVAPLNQLAPSPVAFTGPLVDVVLEPSEYRGVICGVMLDGTIQCAGDGTLVSTSTLTGAAGHFQSITRHLWMPTTLPQPTDVLELGLGDSYACARTSTNVQCWGDNLNRQLGQGGTSTVDILTPVPVMGLGVVDELETGDGHACVRTGGTVQCWGDNIGLQTGEPGTTVDQSLPVTVMGLVDAVDIELGERHSCALRSTGVVSCWGDDIAGQLGDDDGDTADSGIPVDVAGLPGGVTQITVGQDHSCALAAGEVYCWGEGGYGNLGQNNELDSDMALVVPGLTGIVQITAGWNFTCALDGVGDMWCWGYAVDGNLGDGGQALTGLLEVRSPIPFVLASGVTNVRAGNGTTCIETAAGWSCLGFRSAGQLGDGTSVEPSVPMPTMFGL